MRSPSNHSRLATSGLISRRAPKAGFSLIEIMIAVSIMGILVFALYSVFNQTQRAMRSSEIQGDVNEKGRAIMELLSRELEQVVASQGSFEINMRIGSDFEPVAQTNRSAPSGVAMDRTNVIHTLYFLNRQTNIWTAVGYRLNPLGKGVGTFNRWQTSFRSFNQFGFGGTNLHPTLAFTQARLDSTNYHHLAEGVVHFKLTPYDPNGYPLVYNTTNHFTNLYVINRLDAGSRPMTPREDYSDDASKLGPFNVLLQQAWATDPADSRATFFSNALPASLEVELGILEPQTWRQYQVLAADGNPNAAKFLADRLNKVHLFRQRIPIRQVSK